MLFVARYKRVLLFSLMTGKTFGEDNAVKQCDNCEATVVRTNRQGSVGPLVDLGTSLTSGVLVAFAASGYLAIHTFLLRGIIMLSWWTYCWW